MNNPRLIAFIRKFIWMPGYSEELVLDFIRAARAGEAPRMVVFGRSGSGKTRLAQCLSALLPEVGLQVYDNQAAPLPCQTLDFMAKFVTVNPQVVLTSDRADVKLAEETSIAPVIYLPMVWWVKLREEGIDLAADEAKIRQFAAWVWGEGVNKA